MFAGQCPVSRLVATAWGGSHSCMVTWERLFALDAGISTTASQPPSADPCDLAGLHPWLQVQST